MDGTASASYFSAMAAFTNLLLLKKGIVMLLLGFKIAPKGICHAVVANSVGKPIVPVISKDTRENLCGIPGLFLCFKEGFTKSIEMIRSSSPLVDFIQLEIKRNPTRVKVRGGYILNLVDLLGSFV